MPVLCDEALVLDSHPYQDRHAVVALLTPSHGMLRAVARGARSSRSGSGAALQVLSHVRMSAFIGPRAEMATIKEISLVRSSFPLSSNLDRMGAAAAIAELLITFCAPHEPAPRHYRLGISVLEALLDGVAPSTCVAYAQMWVLILGGVFPPLDVCTRCGQALRGPTPIRSADGQPVCLRCQPSGSLVLDAGDLAFLAGCRRAPPGAIDTPVPATTSAFLDLRARHEAERPLKALDFFRRLGSSE